MAAVFDYRYRQSQLSIDPHQGWDKPWKSVIDSEGGITGYLHT